MATIKIGLVLKKIKTKKGLKKARERLSGVIKKIDKKLQRR